MSREKSWNDLQLSTKWNGSNSKKSDRTRPRFWCPTISDRFRMFIVWKIFRNNRKTWVWILFTPQPSGLEGHCHHGPGGRLPDCRTHISVTAWRIFSIWSPVESSRPVVVHCNSHLPHMGLPMGQKLVKSGSTWVRLCRTHISETAAWMYPRNGRADRHGMKGIWGDRVFYLLCDLELWPWPCIFKVKFWKCCISGMGGPIDMQPKGCESIGC